MILSGHWVFLWPRDGWQRLDLPHVAADCRELGFDGVILHSGLNAATEGATRAGAFRDAGLRVAVGIGGPRPTHDNLMTIAAGIIHGAQMVGATYEAALPDLEGAWDGHQTDGQALADRVLSVVPDAASRMADLPWWAPDTTPDGHGTHPHWPLSAFGRFVSRRFPQVYGAGVEGESARMLAWARKQYAAHGDWPVAPCVQGYRRSVADHVAMYCTEADALTWNWLEMDASCREARHALLALRSRGFTGPDAVRSFQSSAGLTADGIAGPRTLAALGLG